jgi:hypothetical protein
VALVIIHVHKYEIRIIWRILTNNKIYAMVKKPTTMETVRLNILHWFGQVQRREENRIPQKVLYVKLEKTKLRGGPRSRWQDEVRGSLEQ